VGGQSTSPISTSENSRHATVMPTGKGAVMENLSLFGHKRDVGRHPKNGQLGSILVHMYRTADGTTYHVLFSKSSQRHVGRRVKDGKIENRKH